MSDRLNDRDFGSPHGWTKHRVVYEVGFRVALFCVLGLLSFLIVFASGALGGSLEPNLAVLSLGG